MKLHVLTTITSASAGCGVSSCPSGDKLAHHDFGVDEVFGTAETYKSNFQVTLNPFAKGMRGEHREKFQNSRKNAHMGAALRNELPLGRKPDVAASTRVDDKLLRLDSAG